MRCSISVKISEANKTGTNLSNNCRPEICLQKTEKKGLKLI